MLEIDVQHKIMSEYGAKPFLRIWRQNVGMGYSYHQVKKLLALVMRGELGAAIGASKGLRPITYGVPGQPDIMGVLLGGRLLGIEVKAEHGRQTSEQIAFQRMMERFGGLYILARSVEDVETSLRHEGYIR